MTSIKLILTGAHAWASVEGPLTSGMVGIPVTIEYDEAWDGLTKNLMCRCSPWGSNEGESRAILNVGEAAAVAHEVMLSGMYLYLGIEGFSSDGKLVMPTTWATCGKIEYGANTCEDPSTNPELSVWNQLQTEMEQIKEYTLTQEQLADIQAYAQEAAQAADEAKEAADEAKQAANIGGSGLYYTPIVTQPTSDTLKFEFKPSVTGAPVPNPVTVELPVSEDSTQNVKLPTNEDGTPNYGTAGHYAVSDGAGGITWVASGNTGGGSSGGDTGTNAHGVVWDLVNVTSSNGVVSVADGTSLSAVLTAAEGYTLGDVVVTMGGEVLTDAWNADTATVTIASVTGDVVISCAGVSAETGTVTLATIDDFSNTGFIRSTGVESISNTSYGYTDYLYIADCISLDVSVVAKAKSVAPVVWYDADKNYLSGHALTDDDILTFNTFSYDIPEGAVYARCSSYIQNVTDTVQVVAYKQGVSSDPDADPDTPATSTDANTVYISTTGDDANTGLSSDAPVATFARAKAVAGTNGAIVFLAGDYWQPDGVDLGAVAKIRTGGTARLIYYAHKFDAAELVEGYERVYSVSCADAISGSLWQHDVADARTEIAFADRHPLHRDRTHRLPSTRIVSVTGVDTTSTDTAGYLATMEATADNYLYYYDASAGMLYFTAPDADFAVHPIIKGSSGIVKGTARDVHIRGLNILYAQAKVGALSGVIEELSVLGGYGGGCIIWDGASGLELVRCEAMGADNDGINGHGSGHVTCRDCWGHDNLDDGESCHDGCAITQYGGLYEHNGSGCTPATGGEGSYYNTIVRNNGYTGISAQGVEAVVMCNGCLATGNQVGFNVGGNAAGMLINCVAGDNGTNFSGGKRYNCVTADTAE